MERTASQKVTQIGNGMMTNMKQNVELKAFPVRMMTKLGSALKGKLSLSPPHTAVVVHH
jgi:hypothetical protein